MFTLLIPTPICRSRNLLMVGRTESEFIVFEINVTQFQTILPFSLTSVFYLTRVEAWLWLPGSMLAAADLKMILVPPLATA